MTWTGRRVNNKWLPGQLYFFVYRPRNVLSIPFYSLDAYSRTHYYVTRSVVFFVCIFFSPHANSFILFLLYYIINSWEGNARNAIYKSRCARCSSLNISDLTFRPRHLRYCALGNYSDYNRPKRLI